MANRIMLNETSYHGAGAIREIAAEAKARAYKKAFVCTDPDLIKFGVITKVTDVLNNEKRAYEFMNCNEYLQTVGSDDILWSSLTGVSEEALNRARGLFAHYPTFIRKFQNGVAEVSWQINPDGQYFMDEDGFGMTDDKEIEIYGFIDRRGKVLVKFQMIKTSDDLKRMRKEAEELIL